MDTMAFVEKFLQAHFRDYSCDLEEKTFEYGIRGKFIDIHGIIYCPEIDEEGYIMFDEIDSHAMLECHIPEDKTGEVVALITHVIEKENNTFARIYLQDHHITASYRFLVWDEMSEEQLNLLLLSPVRYLLDYEEDFLHTIIGDKKKEE